MKIALTGGTGYLGAWIADQLLSRGDEVHFSARSLKEAKSQMENLSQRAPGRIQFYEADLLEPHTFLNMLEDCEALIHCASPLRVDDEGYPEENILKPALKGTEGLIAYALQQRTIKNIIYTSSTTAIYGNTEDIYKTANGWFDETHWNNTSSLTDFPYAYTKTICEKKVWELAKKNHQCRFSVINPGFLVGPARLPHPSSETYGFIERILMGEFKYGLPAFSNPIVDVRDAAKAHIMALEKNQDIRLLAIKDCMTYFEILEMIAELFPELHLTVKEVPLETLQSFHSLFGYKSDFWVKNINHPLQFKPQLNPQEIDLELRPVIESLKEQCEQILENGL